MLPRQLSLYMSNLSPQIGGTFRRIDCTVMRKERAQVEESEQEQNDSGLQDDREPSAARTRLSSQGRTLKSRA